MKCLLSIILFATLSVYAVAARSNTCPLPGLPVAWATDWCMLQLDETNPQDPNVQACVRESGAEHQPCELNAEYKLRYCKALIERKLYDGSAKACLKNPTIVSGLVARGAA